MDEFAFDDHGARAYDAGTRVADYEDEVRLGCAGDEVVLGCEGEGGGVAYCCENSECVEESCGC